MYKIEVTVIPEGCKRLDKFLSVQFTDISRSKIKELILSQQVYLLRNECMSVVESPKLMIQVGDIYQFQYIINKSLDHLVATPLALDILFEDDDLLVINKPANLVVHPGAGNYDNTLVNGLLYKYQDSLSHVNGNIRPGIVHRLDKDTSGVLIIAKNDYVHQHLAEQFATHTIKRHYRALVWGVLRNKKGKIQTFIQRDPKNRLKMAVSKLHGKLAITNYKVISEYHNIVSLLDLQLHTGRTHQIRVHLSSLKHAVVGDQLYTNSYPHLIQGLKEGHQQFICNLNRHCLHAYLLTVIHPITKEELTFVSQEDNLINTLYKELNLV